MIRPRDIIRSIYTNYPIQMQVVKSEINLLHAIMRNLFYQIILRIGLEFFIRTRIGFGLDNFGSDFKH